MSTYCTSTQGTCTMVSAIKAVEHRKMLYDRHFHDLFTWLKLYPWHLSWNLHLRLIIWTQSLKIIILVHINQFPSALVGVECIRGPAILILATRIPEHQSISFQTRSRRVCLITRVSNNHVLFTSINAKIVLADVVFTICNVRTLLVD